MHEDDDTKVIIAQAAETIMKALEAFMMTEKATIAQGLHLLPFRTEKLNLVTPMVLPTRESRKLPPYRESFGRSA